jgi:cullin 3
MHQRSDSCKGLIFDLTIHHLGPAISIPFREITPHLQVDERLNKVVQLFRFLSSKDVFEEFYKQTTAKRLLGGRVASDDVEKLMIGKLKAECGANYTHKLEGMFSDLSKSALFMANFRRERRDRLVALSGGCDIDVTVLTAPNWSSTVKPVPMAVLPPSIAAAAAEFSKYYLDKHNGRKLQWNCGKGTAEVRARIGVGAAARTYELTVSTYQMIMLLAFNGPEAGAGAAGSSSASPSGGAVAIPYRDFLRFDIPEDELKRHLLSLCNPKVRLLNKSTAKKDVDEEDVFTVNDAFASKLLRIKVPLISMKSAQQAAAAAAAASGKTGGAGAAGGRAGAGGDDAGDVMANVEEGRKALLESVIVRVMKARKHMEHNALVAEVIRMVSARFTPDMASIKKRIEHLIERDYMERSAENHNMYAYLA